MRQKTLLIIGSSRGIGASVAKYFHDRNYHIYSVSRTPSNVGEWIAADISTVNGIEQIRLAIGNIPIDALLFMGGVWEKNAFTDQFDFLSSPAQETRYVINVNLIAPVEITKRLSQNLASTPNPRAVYIGSLSGLDQAASKEVANTASKFGLRGAIQSLRLALKKEKIGFTVINPGNVATEEVLVDISEGRFSQQIPIPLSDIHATIEWILNLSPSVEVGDINLMQK